MLYEISIRIGSSYDETVLVESSFIGLWLEEVVSKAEQQDEPLQILQLKSVFVWKPEM